jgi:hypothetical protein
MKSFFIALFFIVNSIFITFSQDGLKGIIVEKYYVSSKEDSKSPEFSGGLEKGSTTYRIYVDLKPGYTFQVAYGSPDHELFFKSKKPFYNHIEHGSECPDRIPLRTYKKNICRLDSWLSVGAAGENQLAVLKSEDDTIQVFPTEGNFLKNKTKEMGRPLTEVDGMVDRTDLTYPTFFQIDDVIKALGSTTNTNFIRIYNGAWAAMGKGTQGLDSLHNRVLIAQLTTKGKLTYKLNLLIGKPDGSSEKYVAKYPKEGEFTHPELTNVK